MKHAILISASAVFAIASTQAAVLIDSIGSAPGTTEAFLDKVGKTLVFQTGSSAYTLDSVVVRLSGDSTVSNPVLFASLYSVTTSGGNIRPSTQLTTFNVPTVPASSAATAYTLTPTGSVVLAPNTTYFFVMYGDPSGGVKWLYDTVAPTGTNGYTLPDIVAGGGVQYGWFSNTGEPLSNPAAWNGTSGNYNDFQLNGTLVPEASSLVLLGATASLGLLRRQRVLRWERTPQR